MSSSPSTSLKGHYLYSSVALKANSETLAFESLIRHFRSSWAGAGVTKQSLLLLFEALGAAPITSKGSCIDLSPAKLPISTKLSQGEKDSKC